LTCSPSGEDSFSIMPWPPRVEFPGALYQKAIFHTPPISSAFSSDSIRN